MSLYQCIWMWLLLFLGGAYIALGYLLIRKSPIDPSKSRIWQKILLLKEGLYSLFVHNQHFPIVILVSPVLLIIYEFLSVLKPDNKFIDNQSKLATRGECGLETSPQLILQLYSIMVSWHSLTFAQKYSIATSCLSLSLPNIEKYVSAQKENYNLKALLKYIPIFASFSLFKIIAIAFICLFFNASGLIFLAGSTFILFLTNYVPQCCQCIPILSWLNLVDDLEWLCKWLWVAMLLDLLVFFF